MGLTVILYPAKIVRRAYMQFTVLNFKIPHWIERTTFYNNMSMLYYSNGCFCFISIFFLPFNSAYEHILFTYYYFVLVRFSRDKHFNRHTHTNKWCGYIVSVQRNATLKNNGVWVEKDVLLNTREDFCANNANAIINCIHAYVVNLRIKQLFSDRSSV